MVFKRFPALLVLLICAPLAFAHDPDEENKTAIRQVIQAVARAWQDGDAVAFRIYFADDKDIRMIEGGTQDIGVGDLIEHHLLPHHQEFAELTIDIKETEIHFVNGYDNAWAISDFDVQIKARDGKETRATGYETFVLQRFNGKWKIVHSHSSTQRVKSQ